MAGSLHVCAAKQRRVTRAAVPIGVCLQVVAAFTIAAAAAAAATTTSVIAVDATAATSTIAAGIAAAAGLGYTAQGDLRLINHSAAVRVFEVCQRDAVFGTARHCSEKRIRKRVA